MPKKRGAAGRGKTRTPKATPPPVVPEKDIAVEGLQGLLSELPEKQRVFVVEYFAQGLNATKAAIAAGYSAKTADSQASRLLKDVKVAAAVAEWSRTKLRSREITAERVLDEVAKLAFHRPTELFTGEGYLRPLSDLDEEEAASIAGIEISERHSDDGSTVRLKKIKLADKGMNLERLMRYMGLFKDRVEHSGSVGLTLVHSVPRPQRGKVLK